VEGMPATEPFAPLPFSMLIGVAPSSRTLNVPGAKAPIVCVALNVRAEARTYLKPLATPEC
jgi:hypothetical protein